MCSDSYEIARMASASWINSADSKATALLSISGALLAVLAAVFATTGGVPSLGDMYRIAFVVFCVTSIISIAASAAVLWPRTDRSEILAEKGWPDPKKPSPTYFGDLAPLSHKDFIELHEKQDKESLAEDSKQQAHIMCTIASAKMSCLRVSVAAFAVALASLGILVAIAAVH